MLKNNTDVQELKKFSELSAQWWDLAGPLKTLHEINPLRLAFIQSHIDLTNIKLIDIGCGGGILSESLAQLGADVIGIDMSAEAINAARLHWEGSSFRKLNPAAVKYQVETAEGMAAAQPDAFDALTCMELLEHVPDPASVIQACAGLVKPSGHLFFSTINRNPKAYLFAILGAEYILKLLPRGTHDFSKFIKPSELATWARQANLEVKSFKGLHYNPFREQHSLNDDIRVNYLVHCQRKD